ncbi:hypothetical protein [Poseidonocella sp. HB161398]|uniref:hypothetical protein n=1 Tax=Poseidonocella sp. HB161398 TaxID=2320855 RepID=UPI0011086B8C|nr:hypothetical protein [Poseidonocella sp. HB161398]
MKPVRSAIPGTGTTDAILEASAALPLHLLPRDMLPERQVSSRSRWGDRRWNFDNTTRGVKRSQSGISWDLDLPDGSNLCDPGNADLLDWLRRLVWSAFAAPGDGAGRLKPGSLGPLGSGLRAVVPWCVDRGVLWPSRMTRPLIEEYVDELRTLAEEEGDDGALTESVACKRLNIFGLVWRQRHALERAGIAPMPEAPFGRRGVIAVFREIGAIAAGSYRPVPNEVGLPILNTAMRMLGTPAEDVLRLQALCAQAFASAEVEGLSAHTIRNNGKKLQRAAAEAFRFSEPDGAPWHPPLDPAAWDQNMRAGMTRALARYLDACDALPSIPVGGHKHVDTRKIALAMGCPPGHEVFLSSSPELHALLDERARREGLSCPFVGPMDALLRLVKMIASAAHVVIQASVGFRISEVCGLQAGVDPGTGLPSCVQVRDSVTGLAEVFIVRTDLSKTEETPREAEWTIGYRPKGSGQLPPAVTAILVVDRLLAPYRQMLGVNDLFVNLSARRGLPKAENGVSRVTSEYLVDNMRTFVASRVDLTGLPDEAARKTMDRELVPWRESHGRILKSHQWRKSFAHFAYMTDPSMLPVLQAHYHHVSIAMTDGGYLSHVLQLDDMNDVKRQKLAAATLEIARGGVALAGRNGDWLEEKIREDLGPEIAGASTEEAYRSAFAYVEEAGLNRMFFEPYGICGARSASEMACHTEAGTAELARWRPDLIPNYATRTPGLCAGCASFAIARWHLPFWEDRYVESQVALRDPGAFEEHTVYGEIMNARARQAAALCRKLGSDIAALDARVDLQMQEMRDASSPAQQ